MKSGAELLRRWMERAGYNQVEAAGFMGFKEPFMSLLLSGKRKPGLRNALKIHRATGVPVESWMLSPRDKTKTSTNSGVGNTLVS